jgi:hypothetical protein
MTVQIIKNFVSNKDCEFIIKNFSKNLSKVKNRTGFFEDLFIRKPEPINTEALDPNNIFDTIEESMASALINNIMHLAIIEIEKFYKVKIKKCVGGMTKLSSGAFHGIHADVCNIDGTKIEDDPEADFLNYSGLLYLSKYNIDFTGGLLKFPKDNLQIEPEPGTFIFFEGDDRHPHEVTEIISGDRHGIVMFFGI